MAKKVGLGRGLDALYESSGVSLIQQNENDISKIKLALIKPKANQPRKDFNKESLDELADSILTHGVIQPIALRKIENGYYEIIAGERRWRASEMVGLEDIPAVVFDVDEYTAAKMTLVENLQREDLNPVEEALGYKFLLDNYNLTQEEIAKQVAKSRSVIANSVRILNLPECILSMIRELKISQGHAKSLLSLEGQEEQIILAEKIEKLDLSVREVEKYVKEQKNQKITPQEQEGQEELENQDEVMYIKSLQSKMEQIMRTKIKIVRKNNKPSGKLEISYHSKTELESLISTLCGEDIFKNEE